MEKIFKIKATHEDDIFDLELKKVHIAFRALGVDNFPREFVKIPVTNMDDKSILRFTIGLQNTWLKRNKSNSNLKYLQDALKVAKKQIS